MVFPASANFQQAAREALPDKSTPFYQCNRGAIVRLDVCLNAVKFELLKCVRQHQKESFMHQTLAGVRDKRIVTYRGALKTAADHIVQIDAAHEAARFAVNDQKPALLA